jgi:hypothetical protein
MRNILSVVFVVLACFAVAAQPSVSKGDPTNALTTWEDSCRIDSTEGKWLTVPWIDNFTNKALLIEARDDSAAGFAEDSASVSIKLYQAFSITRDNKKFWAVLPSHAHPDSGYLSNGWSLYDSLNILDMDTANIYARNADTIKSFSGNVKGLSWGDSILTLQESGFGAFRYVSLSPDFSHGLALYIKGNIANARKGVGSMWKFSVVSRRNADGR